MPVFVSHLSTKDSQLLRMPGARIFVRSTSFVCSRGTGIPACEHSTDTAWLCHKTCAKKLLRKKKNESWAMGPAMVGQTSPTLGVGGNLLCEIAQSGWFEFF